MFEACAANKVLLMEAFMYRYTDRVAKTIQVLRSGALGEIKFISSTFRFLLSNPESIKFKPELGGGALYDVGCYPINFAGLVLDEITGSPSAALPESISVQSVSQHGVDTIFSALQQSILPASLPHYTAALTPRNGFIRKLSAPPALCKFRTPSSAIRAP